ncbi:MAG: hypothetical protein ACRDOJ_05095 [Nocardioidaceae bacterium]
MRRWQVVVRVKRYPSVNTTERTPSLLDPFELGEVTTVESRHWTRSGAEGRAAHLNVKVGPSIMWHAEAERLP